MRYPLFALCLAFLSHPCLSGDTDSFPVKVTINADSSVTVPSNAVLSCIASLSWGNTGACSAGKNIPFSEFANGYTIDVTGCPADITQYMGNMSLTCVDVSGWDKTFIPCNYTTTTQDNYSYSASFTVSDGGSVYICN